MFSRLKQEKGQALILTVMIASIVALISTGLVTVSTRQKNFSGTEVKQERAYFIANAGLTRALTVLEMADQKAREPESNLNIINLFDPTKPEFTIWDNLKGDYSNGEIYSLEPFNQELIEETADYRKWLYTIKSVGRYPKGSFLFSTKTLYGKVYIYELKDGGGGGWIASLPPAIPSGLNAVPGNQQVALSWLANTDKGLGGYNVYRSPALEGEYEKIQQVGKVTSWVDTGLTNGTTYYYKISAHSVVGLESDLSLPASATPFDPAPQIPTGLTATAGDQQITLQWNANSEEDLAGYKIYRSTDDQNYELIQQVGLVTSWSDTGLVNGTTYYYRITAYDTENNESEMSDKVSAVPSRPSPPVTLDFGRGVWAQNASVFSNNCYIDSDVIIHSLVNFSNNADITGNVWASGNVDLKNNTVIHKNLYTNGTVSIHNNVGVVKGNVQAVGNVTLQNDALVSGWVRTEGNVLVENNAEIKGEVWANGTITVNNNGKTGTRHEHQNQELNFTLPAFPVPVQDWYQQHAGASYSGNKTFNPQSLTNISGIYFVDGNVSISGTYTGVATIVASGNITITGDLNAGDANSALALISFSNVTVNNNADPVKALIYARTKFTANNNARIYGGVIAGEIEAKNNSHIYYVESLVQKNPPGLQ